MVEAVGPGVSDFEVGDCVVSVFFPLWQDGPPEQVDFATVPGDLGVTIAGPRPDPLLQEAAGILAEGGADVVAIDGDPDADPRLAPIMALPQAIALDGDLDRGKRVGKVTGFVNSGEGFAQRGSWPDGRNWSSQGSSCSCSFSARFRSLGSKWQGSC